MAPTDSAPARCKEICQKCCKQKRRGGLIGKKYVPPERVQSFKPKPGYTSNTHMLSSDTVQKLSYQHFDRNDLQFCRGHSYKPKIIHKENTAPLSCDTTFKLSYTGVPGERIVSAKPPKGRDMLGKGPFESMTTCRHDFVPKPFQKVDNFKPKVRMNENKARMADCTTFGLSYLANEKIEKPKSYKPCVVYRPPTSPLDQYTVQRLSYQPCEPVPVEDKPWAARPDYKQPTGRMECDTVYKKSYIGCNEGCPRTESFKPKARDYQIGREKLADDTVYKLSFQPSDCADCRPESYKPKIVFHENTAPLSCDTTFKLSYTGVPGERIVSAKPPKGRDMLGKGPFESMTTCRHDFVPKPFQKVESFKPCVTRVENQAPLESCTVMQLSYQPSGVEIERTKNYKPCVTYQKPSGAFACDTVQKLSYMPVEIPLREEKPWVPSHKYEQPQGRLAGDTCYKLSYMMPGTYVEGGAGDAKCDDCYCDCKEETRAHEGIC